MNKQRASRLLLIAFTLLMVAGSAVAKEITFWTMNYQDPNEQAALWAQLAAEFEAETGIKVNWEIVNFSQARPKLTLAATGGESPDVADQFWAYTYADMGQGQYGPMPIEAYADDLFGDLEDRWYASALQDVRYKGHLYGLPWRIDVRPLAYRSDFFAEAGLAEAPDTWDDLVEWGKKLTVTDGSGRILRYGVGIGGDLAQFFYSWLWQAGGSFLNEDFTQPTLNTSEGVEALKYLVDLIHTHQIAPRQAIDPSYDWEAEFAAGKIAIMPVVGSGLRNNIMRTAPQIVEHVAASIPLKHRERVTFQGGGYFGLMYAAEARGRTEEALAWLEFINREDIHTRIIQQAEQISPQIAVSQLPMYTNDPWMKAVVDSIPYGRTTQHPHPAWGQITLPEPGGVIYDMMVLALAGRVSPERAIADAHKKMQDLMNRF